MLPGVHQVPAWNGPGVLRNAKQYYIRGDTGVWSIHTVTSYPGWSWTLDISLFGKVINVSTYGTATTEKRKIQVESKVLLQQQQNRKGKLRIGGSWVEKAGLGFFPSHGKKWYFTG